MLAVAPTALFILVPLFAVLLKLLYLFQGRLYLEHVEVGLYSHAALMLGLLLVFCSALAAPWLTAHAAWAAGTLGFLQSLLLWAMPVYLLVMQKRVYGQSWPRTLLKFAVLGMLYFALFLSVAIRDGGLRPVRVVARRCWAVRGRRAAPGPGRRGGRRAKASGLRMGAASTVPAGSGPRLQASRRPVQA